MPPIRLTDAEMSAVLDAARPIDVALRDAFLQRVASTLLEYREIGPGTVGRVCRDLQAEFFDPPELVGNRGSKRAG